MPGVTQAQKTSTTASNKPAAAKTTTAKPQPKSLKTRLKEAIQSKSVSNVVTTLKNASAQEILSLSKDPEVVSYMKKYLDAKNYKTAWFYLTHPKDLWNKAKELKDKAIDLADQKIGELASSMNPSTIYNIYSSLAVGNCIPDLQIGIHILRNKSNLKGETNDNPLYKALHQSTGYIENQGSTGSGWDKIKYGWSNLDNAGCGIFATFNTMIALGEKPTADDLVDIISYYENYGAIANGAAGTSPKAIARYLTKRGHTVKTMTSFSDGELNSAGNSYGGFITLKLNNKNAISGGGHYESISKKEKTAADRAKDKDANEKVSKYKFYVHNGVAVGPYHSLPRTYKAINGYNAKVFCIMAVNKLKK